ncbi:NADH-quinone oxidoreductase subunit NuoK [Desulfobacterium sp. N47]|uniref:NADH-quinone oxidoreductase subunit K n=1 Tax=uncultured Desulfobacterium sp. TaxID=201089 RepID=E1YML3_9BACT|nr:NAD(P)H-quinone oxidoreductase subunit 4L, chloroplastic [uncultured Desulfobacterium sp.]
MECLTTYLILGALLFCIGIFGILQHNSLIGMLISTELVLNGAAINFMAFNMFLSKEPATGQIFALFIMGVAAAEAAVALSIIITVYRNFKTINADSVSELKG